MPVKDECRDILLPRVMEAFSMDGCPVCRLASKAEEDFLESLLYERVNTQWAWRLMTQSNGLCRYHAWRIAELTSSKPVLDALGPTILYKHVLEKDQRERNDREAECPVCRETCSYIVMVSRWMAGCFDKSFEFIEHYRKGRSLFCINHYRLVVSNMRNSDKIRTLEKVQEEKLNRLKHSLNEYIRKKSHDVMEPITEEEANAWLNAIWYLKGDRSFRQCGL
ncbi:MAG: hypothetical protein GSR87_01450 [Desulfurococcales archaeon]|nr:hypothetical protein [Desulfurococcales archaeon]